mmetsp:Transcript_7501/g.15976  ORF Transcript_7501/g.15976 Transcript_7501/m.15976 type:complete len:115 (+) Transcript_7501:2-346(+)
MIPRDIATSSISSSCSSLQTNSSGIQQTSSWHLKRCPRFQALENNNNSSSSSLRNASWDEWDRTCNPITNSRHRSQQSLFGSEQSSWCLSTQTATSAVSVGRSILSRSSYSTTC